MKRNVISFLNMKGGVGKTTLCKEMAYTFSVNGQKVLIIDIDPQSNCTQSFFEKYGIINSEEVIINPENDRKPSIEKIFSQKNYDLSCIGLEDVIVGLSENLHLIPGELETIFMERETGNGAAEQKLINFLNNFNVRNKYDYIFIDCPPTYSFYTVSALIASDYYFVPLVPDGYSMLGLDLLERVVKDMRNAYGTNFQVKPINNLGVMFTCVDENKPKYTQNMNGVKKGFENKNIYFFETVFKKKEKLITREVGSFIMDTNDNGLIENIKKICQEFSERMDVLNENA